MNTKAEDFQARVIAASEETAEIVRKDPSRKNDPTLPVFQVAAEEGLEADRMLFEGGDKMALLSAIRRCANHDLILPEWASRAYIAAYDRVLNLKIGSWDDAFGRPYPKGSHLAAMRKRRLNRVRVRLDVDSAHRAGRAIDESLFQEVGRRYGLGKTLASELYYGKSKKNSPNPRSIPRKSKKSRNYKTR